MANMVIFPTGLTYSRNTKAPFETNRVFETLALAKTYFNNPDETGYDGMTIVVLEQANFGVYLASGVPQKTGDPEVTLTKLASGGDTGTLKTDLLAEIAKKADKSIKINGFDLTKNITLSAEDIKVSTSGTNYSAGDSIDDALLAVDSALEEVAAAHTTINGNGGEIIFKQSGDVSAGQVVFTTSAADAGEHYLEGTVKGLGSAAYKDTSAFDASGEAAKVKSAVIGASSDASSADTINAAKNYADEKIAAAISSAINIKGSIGTGGDVTTLPTKDVKVGDAYVVKTAGTYANQKCEVGDIIIATATTPAWTVIQNNLDAATVDTLGTVKLGVATVTTGDTVKTYAIGNNASGKLAVSIPLADLQLASQSGHYTPSSGTAVTASGNLADKGTVITGISKDSKGHITAVTATTLDAAKLGAVTSVGISQSSDSIFEASTFTKDATGLATLTLKGKVFDGATEAGETDPDHPGSIGWVPAPSIRNSILFGDGTWHEASYVAPNSTEWGHAGLVPICNEANGGPADLPQDESELESLFLNGAGKWAVVAQKDTTYTFTSGTNGSFTVQASGGSKQTITIGKPSTAGVADKVAKGLSITKKDGTAVTFDGSSAQSIDLSVFALATDLQWVIYE